MMLKGLQAVSSQVKAISGIPARPSSLVTRRRQAAFKSTGKQTLRVSATAEPAPNAPGKAPKAKREATVDLAQVKPGDEFEGSVTAVEGYGAFVNFGAEKDGLVHISQLSNKYVSSIQEAVKAGDVVKVRVLSVDAASGKIALTMKSEVTGAGAAEAEFAEDGEVDEDNGQLEPEEGHEFVYADAQAEFEFPYQMEEEDGDLTVNVVNEFEDADVEVERVSDLPVPLNELVSGKINRVEDYGAFLTVSYGNREYKAFLERDEAKIPAKALSAEELAEFVAQGEATPEYIDSEFEDMKTYYKVGDEVSAFVLDYTERGDINLTQFTDAEVEADGLELDDDEDEEPVEALSLLGAPGVDVLALSPEYLMEDDEMTAEAVAEEEASSDAVSDFRVYGRRAPLSGALFGKGDMSIASVNYPDRPADKVNAFAVNNLHVTDRDFDGDEIYLEDLWQEAIHVPKDALKKLGLKCEYNEKGDFQIVEREGGAEDEDMLLSMTGDHKTRVAAFVEDLLDDEEDEAELPALAMRRPVVFAVTVENIPAAVVKALRNKTGAGMMDCKKALGACEGDEEKAIEWLRQKGLSGADKKAGRVAAEGAIHAYIHPGSRLGVMFEANCETDFVAAGEKFQSLISELGMIIAASPDVLVVSPDEVPAEVLAKEREVEMGKEDIKSRPEAIRAKIVEGRLEKMRNSVALVNQMSLSDPNKTVAEMIKETIAAVGENVQIRRFTKYRLGEGIEKRSNDFAAEVAQQTQAKAPAPKKEEPKKEEPKAEAKPAIQVPAAIVKELRDKTGAGMMDCKKALAENNGDIEVSIEWLRKKGLAGADKKAGRVAAEGAVVRYIHPGSRLGVLLELNCETDFVSAGDAFQKLANSIAMQIAASPQVQYVSAEDIPAEVFQKEKEIEMGREDLQSKPDAIRAKIAEGRVQKLAQEMALLPQPYLMDSSKTVEQAIKEAIAAIGEKISVRRFVKYQLGEGIEKKVMDLAADVAAMTKSS